jgi:gliding motility-associated-like protein
MGGRFHRLHRWIVQIGFARFFLCVIALSNWQNVFSQTVNPTLCIAGAKVPTVFSVEIAGNKNTFKVHFKDSVPPYFTMNIYDSTGLNIFTTHDANEGWNGKYYNHGGGEPDGNYSWEIFYKSKWNAEYDSCKGQVSCIGISSLPLDTTDSLACDEVYIPNAFTYGDDGLNIDFAPKFLCPPVEYEMWIFDRWGNLIFDTKDLHKGWDGTEQGKTYPVQQDTYVYKLKFRFFPTDKMHNFTGHVSVIR